MFRQIGLEKRRYSLFKYCLLAETGFKTLNG